MRSFPREVVVQRVAIAPSVLQPPWGKISFDPLALFEGFNKQKYWCAQKFKVKRKIPIFIPYTLFSISHEYFCGAYWGNIKLANCKNMSIINLYS
jgi:hypothetical protein